MSRKILFFINPVSGTKSKEQLEKKIITKCTEKSILFEILFTSPDGDYTFLKNKIEKDGITDVVICGGDGSISPIISSLLDTKINIGILPLGSGNGLATAAGIPKSIDKAFEIIFRGNASLTDVFLINNRLSCQLSGLGFDAKVAYDFSLQKKRGLNTYIKQAFKNFFSAKTWLFEIEIEGHIFKEEAFCVCIANSNQFGNNFKIAPKASLSDGLLDIVIMKKTSKPNVLLGLIKQVLSGEIKSIKEKDLHKKNVLYFQAGKLKIKNVEAAPLHIDGEPSLTSKEFFIKILPSAYSLLQP
ncbi:MAG: YegS/Rv2252/BmrU family lipid kinase [Ginsengibacter sp.]